MLFRLKVLWTCSSKEPFLKIILFISKQIFLCYIFVKKNSLKFWSPNFFLICMVYVHGIVLPVHVYYSTFFIHSISVVNSFSTQVSSDVVGFVTNGQFTYAPGESESTLFLKGDVPVDKTIDYIDLWLLVCCSVLAFIGIVFAICCLIFNLAFSQKK